MPLVFGWIVVIVPMVLLLKFTTPPVFAHDGPQGQRIAGGDIDARTPGIDGQPGHGLAVAGAAAGRGGVQ